MWVLMVIVTLFAGAQRDHQVFQIEGFSTNYSCEEAAVQAKQLRAQFSSTYTSTKCVLVN